VSLCIIKLCQFSIYTRAVSTANYEQNQQGYKERSNKQNNKKEEAATKRRYINKIKLNQNHSEKRNRLQAYTVITNISEPMTRTFKKTRNRINIKYD
jgi:hypothetical protein